jgi:hypothetical protein
MIGKLCYINVAWARMFKGKEWVALKSNDIVAAVATHPQFNAEIRVLSVKHGVGYVLKEHLTEL